jgi:hypothetical protein
VGCKRGCEGCTFPEQALELTEKADEQLPRSRGRRKQPAKARKRPRKASTGAPHGTAAAAALLSLRMSASALLPSIFQQLPLPG